MGIKRSLLIATFNYGGKLDQSVHDYIVDLCFEAADHPAIGRERTFRINFNMTPLDYARNRAVVNAEEHGVDYLMMIDSDVHPDLYCDVDGKTKPGYADAKRFFPSSLDWMLSQDVPTVVAAPYCGPPPWENVYVFNWGSKQSDCPGPNFSVDQYSREHAATLRGILPADALPTGVMLIDMRVFRHWKHPRFYYEPQDHRCVEKGSTEDVAFSRDLMVISDAHYGGRRLGYCNWDAWSGHNKFKCVGKPEILRPDHHVLPQLKKAMNLWKRMEVQEAESGGGADPSDGQKGAA